VPVSGDGFNGCLADAESRGRLRRLRIGHTTAKCETASTSVAVVFAVIKALILFHIQSRMLITCEACGR